MSDNDREGWDEASAPLTPGDVALDPRRQRKAHEYALKQRYLVLVNLLLSGLIVIVFLVTGASRHLEMALRTSGAPSQWLLVAGYAALVFAGYSLLMAPLSFWAGYLLPHRFGMSTQTVSGWVSDELKSLLIGLVLGIPAAEVIYWLLRTSPQTWWVWAAVFLILFTVVLGHLSPVLIVPLFYKLTPLQDQDLLARVQTLAARTGTKIAGIYTINLSSRTSAANALVMGLGRTKRIALGDTLYAHYRPDEIETIIAHELGHQVRHDLELGIVVQSLLLFGGMYLANLFLMWGLAVYHFAGPGDVSAMPLLLLAIGVFSVVTMPLINAYSRWRESMADRFAVHITGNRQAFVRAMLRLANQNLAEADPPRWVVWMLYSHPPIRDRVQTKA